MTPAPNNLVVDQVPGQPPGPDDIGRVPDVLEQYASLLRIRGSAARRAGILLAVVVIALTAVALLLAPQEPALERQTILTIVLLGALGSSLLNSAWTRAIITNMLEFIDVLQRQGRDHG